MPAHRLTAALVAALLVMLLIGVAAASAAPEPSVTERVFLDYTDNHQFDQDWSPEQLDRALAIARTEGSSFAEFASAVQDKYDRDILGLDTSAGSLSDSGDSAFLPVPVAPGERDQPPWPFLALTALGAALVLTGAGTSIYRRARR